MITNFEEITCELTPGEKDAIPFLLEGFKSHIGSGNAIKSKIIIERLNHFLPTKGVQVNMTGARLRKMCNYIRTNHLIPLIATSRGYYVSYDEDEIRKQIKSLRERASAIEASANGLLHFVEPKYDKLPFDDK